MCVIKLKYGRCARSWEFIVHTYSIYLFNDAFSITDYTTLNERMIVYDEFETYGRKWSRTKFRYYPDICLEEPWKTTTFSVRIAGPPAKIWNSNLPNAKQEWQKFNHDDGLYLRLIFWTNWNVHICVINVHNLSLNIFWALHDCFAHFITLHIVVNTNNKLKEYNKQMV